MSIKQTLRETGTEVRDTVRERLPADGEEDELPDEEAEKIWEEALTGNSEYDAAIIGEEATYTVEGGKLYD